MAHETEDVAGKRLLLRAVAFVSIVAGTAEKRA
jgi:hypothetical protein